MLRTAFPTAVAIFVEEVAFSAFNALSFAVTSLAVWVLSQLALRRALAGVDFRGVVVLAYDFTFWTPEIECIEASRFITILTVSRRITTCCTADVLWDGCAELAFVVMKNGHVFVWLANSFAKVDSEFYIDAKAPIISPYSTCSGIFAK